MRPTTPTISDHKSTRGQGILNASNDGLNAVVMSQSKLVQYSLLMDTDTPETVMQVGHGDIAADCFHGAAQNSRVILLEQES